MLLPIVAGTPGDQFSESTDRLGNPLGSRMAFADGRQFRQIENAAVLLVAGDVLQSSAAIANHVLQTPTAAAVGDKSVTVALGATAVTVDQYKDGYLNIPIGTGFGHVYTIKRHPAVASAGSFVVDIYDTVQVAIPATANSVSIIANQYKGVIQSPTTLTGSIVGIAPHALPASQFGWAQTHGIASVTTNGTVIRGHNISVLVTTAGSAGPSAADTSFVIGCVLNIAGDTDKSLVDLNIG